jgi:hypothetical protein
MTPETPRKRGVFYFPKIFQDGALQFPKTIVD